RGLAVALDDEGVGAGQLHDAAGVRSVAAAGGVAVAGGVVGDDAVAGLAQRLDHRGELLPVAAPAVHEVGDGRLRVAVGTAAHGQPVGADLERLAAGGGAGATTFGRGGGWHPEPQPRADAGRERRRDAVERGEAAAHHPRPEREANGRAVLRAHEASWSGVGEVPEVSVRTEPSSRSNAASARSSARGSRSSRAVTWWPRTIP